MSVDVRLITLSRVKAIEEGFFFLFFFYYSVYPWLADRPLAWNRKRVNAVVPIVGVRR